MVCLEEVLGLRVADEATATEHGGEVDAAVLSDEPFHQVDRDKGVDAVAIRVIFEVCGRIFLIEAHLALLVMGREVLARRGICELPRLDGQRHSVLAEESAISFLIHFVYWVGFESPPSHHSM